MAENRKDSKGHVLKKGESERSDKRYQYTYLDASKRRRYIYAKDLKELREKEKKVERDLADGIDNTNAKITLDQLWEKYLDLKNDLREGTRKTYQKLWDCYVRNSDIGQMRVCDIKKMHIQMFYNKCVQSGLSHNTVKMLNNLIRPSLEMALDNDLIRKNPAKGAMDGIRPDAKERVPLSREEVRNLIDFCINSNTYCVHVPFLTIAIGTCMRAAELAGLTWADVDMEKLVVNVDHQLNYINLGDGCRFHVNEPKTGTGKRTIPMTEAVYKAFIQVKELDMTLGRMSRADIDGYKDFVFITGNGQPFPTNAFNVFLKNIEKAYNREHPEEPIPHLSAHILRHTGCTLLAAKGIDPKVLQNIMGHKDIGVTLNVYDHGSTERTRKELERIGGINEIFAR